MQNGDPTVMNRRVNVIRKADRKQSLGYGHRIVEVDLGSACVCVCMCVNVSALQL